MSARRIAKGSVVIPYRCMVWSDLTNDFMLRQIQIKSTHDEYNWNHTDQLIAGYHQHFSANSKAKQLAIVLLPSETSNNSPRSRTARRGPQGSPLEAGKEREEMSSTQEKTNFEVWIETVTGKSIGELEIRVQSKITKPSIEQKEDTNWNTNPSSSKSTPNKNQPKKSKPLNFRSRRTSIITLPSRDSKASEGKGVLGVGLGMREEEAWKWGKVKRSEWFSLEYDTVYHPQMAFCISFSWLALSGGRLTEWLASAKRRAKRHGLRLVNIPVEFQDESPALFSSPFYCPIEVPLPRLSSFHKMAKLTMSIDEAESPAEAVVRDIKGNTRKLANMAKAFSKPLLRQAGFAYMTGSLETELGFVRVLGRNLWIHKTGMAKVSWSSPRQSVCWYNNYLFDASDLRKKSRSAFTQLQTQLQSLEAAQFSVQHILLDLSLHIDAQKKKSGTWPRSGARHGLS
ncbi:hypothetical protein AAMO2058_000112300 [Amorphochlora amoebiformis]